MARIVYLTSPWLPTGVSWLINCLMELGIKTSTYRRRDTDWELRGGRHVVAGYARFSDLFPAFADNESFTFRDDIEVVWGHVFPYAHLYRHPVILFARDPRDALFLEHGRERCYHDFSYRDWLHWPFHESLLDAVDNWSLFHRLWAQHPNLAVYRYEDYCRNDARTLGRVLAFLGVTPDPERLERALWRSSYRRYAESRGRVYDPEHRRHDLWRGRAEADPAEAEAQRDIEQACGPSMRRLGYVPAQVTEPEPEPDPAAHMALNPFFVDVPWRGPRRGAAAQADPRTDPLVIKTLAFARVVGREGFNAARPAYVGHHTFRSLVKNLGSYLEHAARLGVPPAPGRAVGTEVRT